ncbi:MAG: hypothetical protein ABJF09_00430 [Qipengyuania citrea]|uniref:hypothetical protein n=1 Tax=Qipengyuania citrea TaxID=225971 RepID=UPI003264B09D
MFSIGNAVLGLLGRKTEAPRWLAMLATVLAILLACALAWGAWQAFDWFNDRDAVRDAANEANADFAQDKDEAIGAADIESDQRRRANRAKLDRTQELIDEALENNCVVADYLASDGADCVRPPAVPRPPA